MTPRKKPIKRADDPATPPELVSLWKYAKSLYGYIPSRKRYALVLDRVEANTGTRYSRSALNWNVYGLTLNREILRAIIEVGLEEKDSIQELQPA